MKPVSESTIKNVLVTMNLKIAKSNAAFLAKRAEVEKTEQSRADAARAEFKLSFWEGFAEGFKK